MQREDLDDILEKILTTYDRDISDINMSPNRPFQVEFEGSLAPIDIEPPLIGGVLTPFQTFMAAIEIIGNNIRALEEFHRNGSCDLGYQLRQRARFRVNIFSARGEVSIVMRKLNTEVPTLESLGAPTIFREVIHERNGLVLVTGATGSGKSTTLAAMLRLLNEEQRIHVVTLEDPIEFIHQNIQATFNQRELGTDYDSFPSGLRAALRQAPKVILVGEMRDRETLEIGLMAAETGHLVLSTLHTVDAGQTIARIIGMFDKDEEEQIRIRLADSLRWVVCQRLLKKTSGGRVAIHEIMGNNLRIREIIEHGETELKTFAGVIEANQPMGWQTFETNLVGLFDQGIISEEDAISFSTRKNIIRQKIDYIKNKKGLMTTDLENLQLDEGYVQRVSIAEGKSS